MPRHRAYAGYAYGRALGELGRGLSAIGQTLLGAAAERERERLRQMERAEERELATARQAELMAAQRRAEQAAQRRAETQFAFELARYGALPREALPTIEREVTLPGVRLAPVGGEAVPGLAARLTPTARFRAPVPVERGFVPIGTTGYYLPREATEPGRFEREAALQRELEGLRRGQAIELARLRAEAPPRAQQPPPRGVWNLTVTPEGEFLIHSVTGEVLTLEEARKRTAALAKEARQRAIDEAARRAMEAGQRAMEQAEPIPRPPPPLVRPDRARLGPPEPARPPGIGRPRQERLPDTLTGGLTDYIEDLRREWDELARQFSPDTVTKYVGPRP